MSGNWAEPVEVWERHGRPARFAWRGRIYTVMLVLEHLQAAPHPQAGLMAGRESWRVEATPARGVPPAVYELSHDLAADRWSLSGG